MISEALRVQLSRTILEQPATLVPIFSLSNDALLAYLFVIYKVIM
jgi:hypothetical protein